MQKLSKDIKDHRFERVYLLFGEESFLVRSYKNRMMEAVIGEDRINYHYFEGKNPDLAEVKSLAETLPFFADCRLIILENTGLFKGAAEEWAVFVKSLPDSVCVIFAETEVDKRGKLYKQIGESGYACEMKRQTDAELSRWVMGMLGQYELKITKEALEAFLYKTGDDMELIRTEAQKLSAYALGREGITLSDVEAVCVERVANRIFEMIEAMAGGKEARALSLYYDLLALKEPSMRILFLIARQFNQLMQIKELLSSGFGQSQIAAKLKLRPYAAGKLLSQARVFERDALRSYVSLCVESEEAVKTGNLAEKLAVELVIVKISRRDSKDAAFR